MSEHSLIHYHLDPLSSWWTAGPWRAVSAMRREVVVPGRGFEPLCLAAAEFKSAAYAIPPPRRWARRIAFSAMAKNRVLSGSTLHTFDELLDSAISRSPRRAQRAVSDVSRGRTAGALVSGEVFEARVHGQGVQAAPPRSFGEEPPAVVGIHTARCCPQPRARRGRSTEMQRAQQRVVERPSEADSERSSCLGPRIVRSQAPARRVARTAGPTSKRALSWAGQFRSLASRNVVSMRKVTRWPSTSG